jgi:hypothetical protein
VLIKNDESFPNRFLNALNSSTKILKGSEKKNTDEKKVLIKTATDAFGIFYSKQHLRDGRYIIMCHDPNEKYEFLRQTISIKNRSYPAIVILGHASETSENHAPHPHNLEKTEQKTSIEEELEKYKEATGKEVKLTEKTKRQAPQMTEGEASKRLEQISTTTERDPQPALYTPPEKPSKNLRTGPRELTSEHERIWREGKQEEKTLLASSVTIHKTPQEDFRDNPKAWQRPEPGAPPRRTVWESPASTGLQNMAKARAVSRTATSQRLDRRRRGIAKPPFARRARNAQAARRAEQEMMSSFKTALSVIKNIPGSRQAMIILSVFLFIIILYIILFGPGSPASPFGGGGSGESGEGTTPPPPPPPIPGFTLTLSGPEIINNGELISYRITFTYNPDAAPVPLEEITVFNNLPQSTEFASATGIYVYEGTARLVSWSLADPQNSNGFEITLSPNVTDSFIENKVYARANVPAPTGGAGGVCSEGFSFCSVSNLMPYFGGDETKARQASIICNRESGSNPGALNNGCLRGESVDYSIGLFQINLLAHCPGAFSGPTLNPCTVADQAKLDACHAKYADPIENIKKAVELSSGGTYWVPWSAAKACGIIN